MQARTRAMEEFRRYAVYVAPEPGPLAGFAADWLGWDPVTGTAREHPSLAGLPRPVAELTATPRKYGFHATLKPPFRLAETSSRARLEADLAALAARLAPVVLPGLELAELGGFLALVPEGRTDAGTEALRELAAHLVRGLDHHRAAPGTAELARRRQAGLTTVQEENLARWGYPYVMAEFRFHMTLTGRLMPGEAARVRAALAPMLAPLLPRPFRIADLCLFGEDRAGMFHLLHRYTLAG